MRRFLRLRWLAAAAVLLLVMAATLCDLYARKILTVDSGDVKADVIVVCGGSMSARPERAAELFRAGAAPKVLVTGFEDADVYIQILEKNGVPESAITREDRSTSTLENAKFSVPLLRQMGVHSVILVTHWYHSRRALACFEHIAPDLTFYSRPTYVQENLIRRDGLPVVATEYVKIVGYWLLYGVRSFGLREPGVTHP